MCIGGGEGLVSMVLLCMDFVAVTVVQFMILTVFCY